MTRFDRVRLSRTKMERRFIYSTFISSINVMLYIWKKRQFERGVTRIQNYWNNCFKILHAYRNNVFVIREIQFQRFSPLIIDYVLIIEIGKVWIRA